jgi:hypothetical protein
MHGGTVIEKLAEKVRAVLERQPPRGGPSASGFPQRAHGFGRPCDHAFELWQNAQRRDQKHRRRNPPFDRVVELGASLLGADEIQSGLKFYSADQGRRFGNRIADVDEIEIGHFQFSRISSVFAFDLLAEARRYECHCRIMRLVGGAGDGIGGNDSSR